MGSVGTDDIAWLGSRWNTAFRLISGVCGMMNMICEVQSVTGGDLVDNATLRLGIQGLERRIGRRYFRRKGNGAELPRVT